MRLNGDDAASGTLSLGTTAVVTNLETGKSAHVTIRDRGPYVGGRINSPYSPRHATPFTPTVLDQSCTFGLMLGLIAPLEG